MRLKPSSALLWAAEFLALLFMAGCGPRPVCPPGLDGLSEALRLGEIPRETLHARIRAETRKGPLLFSADGDLFFVPPDTLRLQVRSDWGEALFDLRAAGSGIAVVPENMRFIGDWMQSLGGGKALCQILAGRPGMAPLLESDPVQIECGKSGAAFRGARYRVLLNRGADRMIRLETADSAFFVAFDKFTGTEPGAGLPGRIRFGLAGGDFFDLVYVQRIFGRKISGESLLK